MKIIVNKEIIKALNPCKSGYENYLKHYANFEGDLVEFLDLEKIPAPDKVWLAVRLLPRFEVEVFAIDCAFSAYAAAGTAAAGTAAAGTAAAADAAYTADVAYTAAGTAAYAAANAAAYAAYAAGIAAERKRQIEALIYLYQNIGGEV